MNTWINLKQFILNVIGTYTSSSNGDGIGSLDIPFILAGILFIVIVYWFFKFLFYIFHK